MATVMMRATAAGPAGVYLHGRMYDVSAADAAALVAGGYAVAVTPAAPETAERVAADLAVLRRPRRPSARAATVRKEPRDGE